MNTNRATIAKRSIAGLAGVAASLAFVAPAFASDASGSGTSQLVAKGRGAAEVSGEIDRMAISGRGVLVITDRGGHAHVVVSGSGGKASGGNSTVYAGFDGKATVTGSDVTVRLVGANVRLGVEGHGSFHLTGKGAYDTKPGVAGGEGPGTPAARSDEAFSGWSMGTQPSATRIHQLKTTMTCRHAGTPAPRAALLPSTGVMTVQLPRSAAVVIIGGGVMGTSIAFHLAEAGVADVLLLERDQFGAGSTTRAAGGVRAQFSDATNVAISQRSLELFDKFGTRPGQEIDLRRIGYLFLLTTQANVAEFERSVALQNSMGVPSRIISAAEASGLNPLINTDDVLAAAWCPTDGIATPDSVVAGYAAGARVLGARLRTNVEVTGIAGSGGRITGVTTGATTIATDTVICAAGAWSQRVGEMIGVHLDVTPLRRQILFTGPVAGVRHDLPMTIDFDNGFYFHPEGPGVLMGMADRDEQPGFLLDATPDFGEWIAPAIARRAPALLDAEVRGGWAGLYEVTPDHNALIGEAVDVERFLYATGFSGHGFQQGPAVGEIMRDLYLRRPPAISVEQLDARRFEQTALRPEFNVV